MTISEARVKLSFEETIFLINTVRHDAIERLERICRAVEGVYVQTPESTGAHIRLGNALNDIEHAIHELRNISA